MVCSVIVIPLLVFATRTHAKKSESNDTGNAQSFLDNVLDKLADKLFDWALAEGKHPAEHVAPQDRTLLNNPDVEAPPELTVSYKPESRSAVPDNPNFGALTISDEHKVAFEFPKADNFTYTSYYCEENVWRLCDRLNKLPRGCKLFAVFMSVAPLWYQHKRNHPRQSNGKYDHIAPGFMSWDWHAFALLDARQSEGHGKAWIMDLDSTLDFPCNLEKYIAEAIRPSTRFANPGGNPAKRQYRVIAREEFLENFLSDRSHMLNEEGKYKSQIPPEPPIGNGGSNLFEKFVSMDPKVGFGTVLSEEEFFKRFSSRLIF